MATLPEQVMLFALNERRGAVTSSSASTALNYGLAGATLLDLALQERLAIEERQVRVIDPSPTQDSILDAALTAILQERRPRNSRWWVGRLPTRLRPLRNRVLQQMHAKGLIRIETGRVLGVFRYDRYWITDREPKAILLDAMHATLFEGRVPEPRLILLMDLLHSCRLFERLFPTSERREVRRRLQDLARSSTVSKAVSRAIRDMEAAVIAAIAASVTVSTTHR